MAAVKIFFDIEVYQNYFLAMFRTEKGSLKWFEMHEDHPLDTAGLRQLLTDKRFTFISFNGNGFDVPLLTLALSTDPSVLTCETLKEACDQIIVGGLTPWAFYKKYKLNRLDINHIDLIEPAPGINASLKIYGGRMHAEKMQDLPIKPYEYIEPEQRSIIAKYCANDLVTTALLYEKIRERIELREMMSQEYGVDLRSKSDAQVAEAVLSAEVERMTGQKPVKQNINYSGFRYAAPSYIGFRSEYLTGILSMVKDAWMAVDHNGYVQIPEQIEKCVIAIGDGRYKIGIGGLHSQEKTVSWYSDDEHEIYDIDVVSYYPNLMLNMRMYPDSMGPEFLTVFRNILDRRVAAKRRASWLKARITEIGKLQDDDTRHQLLELKNELSHQTAQQESLKISLNGTFGKTSSKYSVLYNPILTMQTTITGQLSLLMLIELFEEFGIKVISANTDGIVTYCPVAKRPLMPKIIAAWEKRTGLQMEETTYKSIHFRDVNNYIAVKTDGKVKTKGVFAETSLMKTPQNEICSEAVCKFLCDGTQIADTLRDCKDIRKFVTVRTVKGSAVKDGVDLGKAIRWYYATGTEGTINYLSNGNTVPRTEGAKPLMDLPAEFPDDVNYEWYERECNEMLMDIGVYERPVEEKIPRKNSKAWKELLDAGLIRLDLKGKSVWVK